MRLEDIPVVDWPNDEEAHMVFQAYVNDKPFLLCGKAPEKSMVHGTSDVLFLRNFLRSLDIEYSKLEPIDMDYPQLEGERYKVVGIGMMAVNLEEKKAYICGTSAFHYDLRGLDEQHLEKVIELSDDWIFDVGRLTPQPL